MGKKLFSVLLCLILGMSASFAQTVNVTGKVTDAAGQGLVGASVFVAGTTNGTMTDASGNYSLSVPSNATLTFSFIGFTEQLIAVGGRKVINVILEEDVNLLNETIVVAFGTTTKEAFTGSASVVKSEDLQKRSTANVTNALVGSVPGLQMKGASGAPGAGSGSINIRGISSLSASTDPLVIVDGAPYPASLTNIPQNDIESVTVLKDAASAALYGARGAAGVILVTTKRSKSRDAIVNVDMRVGVNSRGVQDHDVITEPGQFYEAYYSSLYNYYKNSQGYSDANAFQSANTDLQKHLGYNVYTLPEGQFLIGSNGKLNPNATLGRSYKYGNETYYLQPDNWRDMAYKNALRQDYNISVSGGNDRGSYYSSIGYLNEDGIIEYSGYHRITARIRADYQVKKWMKVGANVGFTQSHQESNPNMGTSWGSTNLMYYTTYIAPIYPVYVRVLDANGNPTIRTDEFGHEQYDYGVATTNYPGNGRGFMQTGNPFGSNRYNKVYNDGRNLTGTFNADFDITDHLKAVVQSTVNWGNTLSTSYDNPYYGPKVGVNGELYKGMSNNMRYNQLQTLTYANSFGNHNVNVMLGHEYYKTQGKGMGITAQGGFSPELLEVNSFANVLYSGTSSSTSDYNVEGYFVSAQYDFDKKYYLSASFRRDASSTFAVDHRWGNFWSVGGAWIMNKEPWMAGATWIDQLKLKASIGQQGNDSITSFAYTDTYSLSKASDIAMSPEIRLIGNPEITWETTTNSNIGVEFSFWKTRFTGALDAYFKKTADLLFWISVPESAGSRGYYGNIGDIGNRGLEFTFNVVPVRTRTVEWSIGGNISTNYAWIIKLPESKLGEFNGYYESSYWWTPGGVMRDYMTYEFAGLDENGQATFWYDEDMSPLGHPDDPDFANITNRPGQKRSGVTTDTGKAQRYTHGSMLPKFFGGLNTSLRIGNFDLSATFDYQYGGVISDNVYSKLMTPPTSGSDAGYNYHMDIFKAWSPENPTSKIPRWQYGDKYATAGDVSLTDASYINFQSFSVGYNLPVTKMGIGKLISRIRLYAVGENLGYISARKGFDPRASFSGTSSTNVYSPVRSISGGVQVTF
ncbi:MAG: SusC/RagA family TonB-linked outer membrane protein [Bacteroidales bacterium]|nr:SusC/RagA family TonB-linked outer membrane protein [Bacteroidales bacterium]